MNEPGGDAARTRIGYLEVLGAAVLWAASGPFSVTLMEMGATPESLALLRPLLGAIALLAVTVVRTNDRTGKEPITPRIVLLLVGAGGIGVGLFQLAFQFSTEAVGVPTTVGLLYLAPAIVVALAGPVVDEWPGPKTVAVALVSVGGVWLMVRGAGTATDSGSIVWGVTCGISAAAYTLFGRVTSPRFGAFTVILYSTIGGSLALLGAWGIGIIDVALPPPESWPLLVVFAVTTMAIASLLYFDGLKKLEASKASITATAEPVVASILATLLLGQTMQPIGWFGLMLVVGGVAGAYGLTESRSSPRGLGR